MLLMLSALVSLPAFAAQTLNVVSVNNDPKELALKVRVEQVVKKYKLEKWLYTGKIHIDKNVWPPHSHPVLTLGVRDVPADDDLYLAGLLLHEQFHWNMVLNAKFMPAETAARTKVKFPSLNPNAPKGAGGETSTYNHVLVCYMEYKALASVFGEEAARKALKALPFYTDIYALVSDRKNQEAIEELMRDQEVRL